MICPNCGEPLPEGSRFCGKCGTKLQPDARQGSAAPTAPADGIPAVPAKTDETDANTPAVAAPEGGAAVNPRGSSKKALLIALGALFVLAAAVAFVLLAGKRKAKNTYVYLANGRYYLLQDPVKNDAFEMASAKGGDASLALVQFDRDGKYLYYYSGYDDAAGTGTLCRTEYGRLKAGSGKNDRYLTVIASDVAYYEFMAGDTRLYRRESGGVESYYYYDGKDSQKIFSTESDGYSHIQHDGKTRFVYGKETEQGIRHYAVDLASLGSEKVIAEGMYILLCKDSVDDLLFYRHEYTGEAFRGFNGSPLISRYTLYRGGFDRELEPVTDQTILTLWSDYANKKVYYVTQNGESLPLYDYLEDQYLEQDANAAPPQLSDYEIPVYRYDNMSRNSDLSQYTEFYTSCTREMRFWYYSSMKTYADRNTAYYADVKVFYDAYVGYENEDGYIPLNDEIIKDLKKIVANHGTGYENEWFECIFGKRQTDTILDHTAYDAAYAAYNKIAEREQLREQAKASRLMLGDLYCYENGSSMRIAENIAAVDRLGDALLYNTPDSLQEKPELSECGELTWFYSRFSVFATLQQDYFYLTGQNKTIQLPPRAWESLADARISGDAVDDEQDRSAVLQNLVPYKFYVLGDELVMECGDRRAEYRQTDLYTLDLSEPENADFKLLAADVKVEAAKDGALRYYTNLYEQGDEEYGDYCVYQNGTLTCRMNDVQVYNAAPLDNTMLLARTGGTGEEGYELTLVDARGNRVILADRVTQSLVTQDGELLYISDGVLFRYDEKGAQRLADGVDAVWCSNRKKAN